MLEFKHKPFAHYLNGQLWLAQKDAEKAESGFKQALARKADYTDALYALASLKRETGDVKAFVDYAKTLYKAAPGVHAGHVVLDRLADSCRAVPGSPGHPVEDQGCPHVL